MYVAKSDFYLASQKKERYHFAKVVLGPQIAEKQTNRQTNRQTNKDDNDQRLKPSGDKFRLNTACDKR